MENGELTMDNGQWILDFGVYHCLNHFLNRV
jgi:hypothetical protein